MSGYEHYQHHFDAQGLCQCGCEECHLRLTGLCVCPRCPCDDPAHAWADFDDENGDTWCCAMCKKLAEEGL